MAIGLSIAFDFDVSRDESSAKLWPQIRSVLPGSTERAFVQGFWDDKNFVATIEKTGRHEVCWQMWAKTRVVPDRAGDPRWLRGLRDRRLLAAT